MYVTSKAAERGATKSVTPGPPSLGSGSNLGKRAAKVSLARLDDLVVQGAGESDLQTSSRRLARNPWQAPPDTPASTVKKLTTYLSPEGLGGPVYPKG